MVIDEISENYRSVCFRVSKTAGDRTVHLIAVSKVQSPEAIETLYRLGHRDFGENYAQELLEKAQLLKDRGCTDIRWHFIGHLQTNKVKALIPWVCAIHSVDSVRLAREVAKQVKASGRPTPLPIFVEVNIDNEPGKSGISVAALHGLLKELAQLSALHVEGLMCIPAPDSSEKAFAALSQLEKASRPLTSGGLSMGMTQDFEEAICHGATHIRVGSAIFGARPRLG